ncbi:unnamed protein product [Heligmosomoides polygyrus]|uniref:Nucleoporin_N domain-containing protein n=1 Tax=Heligmosomoides polygyrus TaxID=6339 RepID=A0A183GG84_HELPZ|nr:unnamed protein product [Heligmosomoides polygyrus]
MSAPMYERDNDMKLTVGSISAFPNNLSVCYLETRNTTYACVVQKTQVHTVNWDSKNESVSWDSINISDTSTDKPVNVLQASLVLPNARTLPLLVVGTTSGAQIFDMRTQKLLEQQNIETGLNVGFLAHLRPYSDRPCACTKAAVMNTVPLDELTAKGHDVSRSDPFWLGVV